VVFREALLGLPWRVWDKALMIQPFSCSRKAGNVFTGTLNGFGQWSYKILLLRKKKAYYFREINGQSFKLA
jgi:hypothetical protein